MTTLAALGIPGVNVQGIMAIYVMMFIISLSKPRNRD